MIALCPSRHGRERLALSFSRSTFSVPGGMSVEAFDASLSGSFMYSTLADICILSRVGEAALVVFVYQYDSGFHLPMVISLT